MHYCESWKSFDEVWKHYDYRERRAGDIIGSFFEKLRVEELMEKFAEKKTIINIGCGSGKWSLPFINKGFAVANFDISSFALEVAKRRCGDKNALYTRGDVKRIPFKDNAFDIVMSFGLLEHFKDTSEPITEMVRILKPGGIFIADIITRRFSVQTVEKWINFAMYVVYALIRLDVKRLKNASWFIRKDYYENSYHQQEYLRTMMKVGLEKTKICGKRCFPLLRLPAFAERFTIPLMVILEPIFKDFDRNSSRFSNWWGAIWEVSGRKPIAGEDNC